MAPLAVKVLDVPGQILVGETVTFGLGLTITNTLIVLLHPKEFVALIVYMVVDAGETTTLPVELTTVGGLNV